MSLKIIHIVSSFDRINFGIWNAAIFGLDYLADAHHVTSLVWSTSAPPTEKLYPANLHITWIGTDPSEADIDKALREQHHDTNTIVVSHGCWLQPTKLAHRLSLKGFKWLYVPHGMLEPWSMSQGSLKKNIYYHLFEKRYIRSAKRIRAVSSVEQTNLAKKLDRNIDLIENGVPIPPVESKSVDTQLFLFLGRLHHKKGLLPLVEAWSKSMKDRTDCKLIIAGPDQGELQKIQPYILGNIEYAGPVYGDQKNRLLSRSHYFVLPSYSEGFPVSVLEAMSFGLIPLISKGCNFDAVFEQHLGYNIEPDARQIQDVLSGMPKSFDLRLSEKSREFVVSNYSDKSIGDRLYDLYRSM